MADGSRRHARGRPSLTRGTARRCRESSTAYESAYANATATPPPLGTGRSWSLRAASGRSTSPQRRNRLRITGVSSRESSSAAIPTAIREYIGSLSRYADFGNGLIEKDRPHWEAGAAGLLVDQDLI